MNYYSSSGFIIIMVLFYYYWLQKEPWKFYKMKKNERSYLNKSRWFTSDQTLCSIPGTFTLEEN